MQHAIIAEARSSMLPEGKLHGPYLQYSDSNFLIFAYQQCNFTLRMFKSISLAITYGFRHLVLIKQS